MVAAAAAAAQEHQVLPSKWLQATKQLYLTSPFSVWALVWKRWGTGTSSPRRSTTGGSEGVGVREAAPVSQVNSRCHCWPGEAIRSINRVIKMKFHHCCWTEICRECTKTPPKHDGSQGVPTHRSFLWALTSQSITHIWILRLAHREPALPLLTSSCTLCHGPSPWSSSMR